MSKACRNLSLICVLYIAALFISPVSFAQTIAEPEIDWEVTNRFRLFKNKSDFDEQVEVYRQAGNSVLKAEQLLASRYPGTTSAENGWARKVYRNTCFNPSRGLLFDECTRDQWNEGKYLNPLSYPVQVKINLGSGWTGATCSITYKPSSDQNTRNTRDRTGAFNCIEGIAFRIPSIPGSPSKARTGSDISVEVRAPDGRQVILKKTLVVQDLLIVGMGDSLGSGEGNPDRPVQLSNKSFCYWRLLHFGPSQFWRPAREYQQFSLDRDCGTLSTSSGSLLDEWISYEKQRADWLFPACHRALSGYQLRSALTLAVENRQSAVTYIPLGCTGATISEGLYKAQKTREVPDTDNSEAPVYKNPFVPGQIDQLRAYLAPFAAQRRPDLIFLTIGANDIGFSGLVAHVMMDDGPERTLLSSAGMIVKPDAVKANIGKVLIPQFRQLRNDLKKFTGGSLRNVVFVPYFMPVMSAEGICATTRRGFDIHPAFSLNHQRAKEAVAVVVNDFFPTLADLATCGPSGQCKAADTETMAFAPHHQPEFERRGMCATAASDPIFDRQCFRDGDTFLAQSETINETNSMRSCGDVSRFRTYTSRQRWVHTPNDSYFAAMSYPESPVKPVINPSNLHDPLWGLLAAVYGGAVHPTAEGHAAMADSALLEARKILKP